ncbi:DNA oxidative demethylase AlkB [Pseudomonas sp. FSL R10-0056]|uniref:Alpha-ketoglutarate-dependent dioxygenase AlkB n=3 Tax=Pseudomonas TaxID=286 RepID=A0A266NKR4_PSEFR|nr:MULTISPECIES: DNA oxidative demethylase AlkB [Pseudomonas]MBP3861162.1 DNA oxidative demethylase AlkB [Pseudomonas sp.]MCH4881615.1 DNA oxidative demethylase AlkB [Pseudomonas sp. TMW22080]MQT62737.1 DNA oxidative demethylase AlkB [Pseudomonas sp. FSL R10-0056]MQT66490.1 DNA oxidative demethylase AlkB [Pseudomonas sp. FSL R10-0071]MQT85391.1 DNA oxidative demethylase AlkB [Pseudomonas sp. FSL R10-2964]MQU46800.1 DNA oxidative demethylase AlkB [Pseudomonas sp. FSL A6-1183]MQU53057.1 DNA ox
MDLFAEQDLQQPARVERISDQAFALRGFALPKAKELLAALDSVLLQAPLRQMQTPGGYTMSARLSSCGALGWTTDRDGYHYSPLDPLSARPWPAMPGVFLALAAAAASSAGFSGFVPDSCLINAYAPGAKMSLHQDKNERCHTAPIVSISLGLPAIFQFGGFERSDPTQRIALFHGDIMVWGGVDRLRYHGVMPIKPGHHSLLGEQRINITLRQAG